MAVLPCLAQNSITAVRFWSLGEVTRIAVEADAPIEHRWERLYNPDRLFFDLPGFVPREHRTGIRTIPVGDRLLRQIRVAETQLKVTRIVLDLEGPVEFAASQLANPDRLMIELRAPAQAVPPAAAGAPPAEPTVPTPVPASAPPAAKPAVASGPKEAQAPPTAAEVAQAAQRDSRGKRSLIRALGLKVSRVVLDPGHGGHDTGSIGPSGLIEKELVLDLSTRLGKLIAERLGSEVVYTRTDDTFVPLESRTELANEKKADLFISVHANSSRLRTAAGIETFYMNFTAAADALEVAARENASSPRAIHELQGLIEKIAQKEKVQESREFAANIQKAVHTALRNPGGRDRGVKKAPFLVLIGAQMPSVLVEVAFLSNPREEKLLLRPDYRQRLAEALYKGIAQYAGTLSHFQLARGKSE
ncbi:MAG: N-acetylmuramoyl-L-alanine amidase [Acidobacteriota bacterium]